MYDSWLPLWGRASDGKIKCWRVSVDEGVITIRYGFDGGAEQVTERKVSRKNVGKSNETTLFEQACLEAESLWKSKTDEGYVTDKNNIPKASTVEMFLPMLAHVWEKRSKHLKLPAFVQPKLDGVRCLARKIDGEVKMWSRKGKIIDIPIEIRNSLQEVLKEGQCTDGELYVHGWTFQQIVSATKKYRPDTTPKLEYHIYDCPVKDVGFDSRFVMGLEGTNFPYNLIKVPTHPIVEIDETTEWLEYYLQRNYEGLMVRNYSSTYKFKHRSNDLLKMKKFMDAEYLVTGVAEASGKDEGTAIFICQTNKGQEFRVRPTGSIEDRREYFENFEKYKNRMITVKFQELTDDGIPRFPVGLHFRPDWDMS